MAEKIRHFTDLTVWKKAHQLFLDVLRDVEGFPSRKSAAVLAEQTLRSTGPICANIAEGFNRSKRKFVNSLDIALGEANETENWLYKARDAGFLKADVAKERLLAIVEIEKMLTSLKSRIEARENS